MGGLAGGGYFISQLGPINKLFGKLADTPLMQKLQQLDQKVTQYFDDLSAIIKGKPNVISGNLVLESAPDTYFKYIAKRSDVDPGNYYDIVAHGHSSKVQMVINGQTVKVDHRFVAKMLLHSKDYTGQPIRLLSCNTGSLDNGFAQNLANYLNVEVMAPNRYLWAYPNGKWFVAGGKYVNNVLTCDFSDIGIMKVFYPGGNK